ncbi:hypothetical protein Tco_0226775 [Tanacetum coccineum]
MHSLVMIGSVNMERGFLCSEGRGVKQKKGEFADKTSGNIGKNIAISEGNQDLTIGSTSPTLIPNEVTTRTSFPTTRTFSNVDSEIPSSQAKKGNEQVGNIHVMYNILSSYANKLSHTSLNKANLWKLKTNVPNDDDYKVWLPLALVYEVKFHDFSLVAYTLDGLSLVTTKLGTPMMLYSYANSMCLELWGRSSYARILIKINACNDFSDNLCSTCLIFGHSFDDCPKAPKRVVNKMDKVKGGSFGANDEGFIKVKKKKSGEEGKSSNPLLENINIFEKQLLKGKCVLVDDEGKPLDKVDYFGDQGSEDEVESVDNKMASYLASKSSGVGYGTKSLSEQLRETYVNDEYDPYDDDMYKGQEILDNIQSICDNLDIKV